MSRAEANAVGSAGEGALPGRWGPVSEGERIVTLDVLRGVAICGMLLANILIFAFPAESRNGLVEGAPASDQTVALFLALFVEGKFYTLFSILFGMGLALQSLRAEERSRPFIGVYIRRVIVLFVMGLLHAALLSAIDILAFYALIALIALPFRKLKARSLLVTTVALYLGSLVALGVYVQRAPGGVLLGEPDWGELAAGQSGAEASRALIELTLIPLTTSVLQVSEPELYEFMADEEYVFREGAWAEQVRHRVVSYLVVAPIRLIFLSGRVLALFLLGIFFVRIALFVERDRNPGVYKTMVLSGLALGLLLEMVGGMAQQAGGGSTGAIWVTLVGFNLGIPALSLAYAGSVALACRRPAESPVVLWLAALGRTALTNYVGQSVIFGLLFYSYGLGLFGELSGIEALLLAVPILTAQVVFSVAWLKYFRFGPLEWGWRTLTYGRLQPIRTRASMAAA